MSTTNTLYKPGTSRFHDLYPLTKLSISGVILAAAVGIENDTLVLAVFIFILLPLAAWGQNFRPYFRACLLLIWPFALSLTLIQGFFTPGENILFTLGPLSMKMEGLEIAYTFTVRILLGLGGAILLMFFTRPDHLMLALTERGLPHQVGYLVVTTMQIIPRFQEKAQTILNAQRSRGLETEGSLVHRLRMLLPLVGPLVLGSIIDVDERAIALEARAFSHAGKKSSLQVLHDTQFQKVLRMLMILVMVALPVQRIWWQVL